jgi:hypothetical protein
MIELTQRCANFDKWYSSLSKPDPSNTSIDMKTKIPLVLDAPSKHFRLVSWRLLYRVDVCKTLARQDELEACLHARLSLDKWDAQKALFPQEWPKLLAKRQRRLDWFFKHGSIEDGWTPPDPNDRRSANRPVAAYLARRKLTLEDAHHLILAKGTKYRGKKPLSPQVTDRINRWDRDEPK